MQFIHKRLQFPNFDLKMGSVGRKKESGTTTCEDNASSRGLAHAYGFKETGLSYCLSQVQVTQLYLKRDSWNQ